MNEVLLRKGGHQADPVSTARLLHESADVLLNGGEAPSVNGDDDEIVLPAISGRTARLQLIQERRLVRDLAATGNAYLAGHPVASVHLTAGEHISARDPVDRLRILAAVTSNVSLDAARTIANRTDRNIGHLITFQVMLGVSGFLASVLLSLGLIAATRRQTAHFRSLVTSSTDLVLVFGEEGCRYVSESVGKMLGSPAEVLGAGFERFVERTTFPPSKLRSSTAMPAQVLFQVRTGSTNGEPSRPTSPICARTGRCAASSSTRET